MNLTQINFFKQLVRSNFFFKNLEFFKQRFKNGRENSYNLFSQLQMAKYGQNCQNAKIVKTITISQTAVTAKTKIIKMGKCCQNEAKL